LFIFGPNSFDMNANYMKLIGVQSNHDVEYFGGSAAPTHQFLHNQRFPHNQHVFWWLPPALADGRTSTQSELVRSTLS
jgi:hypothetical protein